ncbi:hypothetical protein BpHYR1_002956 [Brachionus plicatilis]|uniref:Uncharacterized protein n=1 Tax=Brachionus plicatilis TaxID=10195 RepID=A0A3M7R610_BRAPC|nr:hypothetical protein BpHYR1_002956 [Brachionus plicatilis]
MVMECLKFSNGILFITFVYSGYLFMNFYGYLNYFLEFIRKPAPLVNTFLRMTAHHQTELLMIHEPDQKIDRIRLSKLFLRRKY